MRRSLVTALAGTAATAAIAAFAVPAATAAAPAGAVPAVGTTSAHVSTVNPHVKPFAGVRSEHTCAQTPRPGHASCLAEVLVGAGATAHATAAGTAAPAVSPAAVSGYGPSDIQSAYNLSGASGAGKTVAIVDAYDDPTAESDLATYRSNFGLPAANFTKVDQNGGTNYPATDAGWATEESLDLDMVSATCPDCSILLVEADSTSFADLGAAVNTAASLGATAISNSYGGSDTSASSDYDHPGIAVTASTGDAGYGVESPASFDTVVAVGGTSLYSDGTESAWDGAGSGCSSDNAKPAWQTDATQCSGKANADVSAVADPSTGVAVYDSTPYNGASGWQVYGGTSASSPIIASVYAMGGVNSDYAAEYTWENSGGLNDVTSGSNGSCSPAVLCTSGAGWDGPTGLGTPNGTSSF